MTLLIPVEFQEQRESFSGGGSAHIKAAKVPDGRPPAAVLFGADYSARTLTPSFGCQAPDVVRAALDRFSTYDADHDVELNEFAVYDLGDAGLAHAEGGEVADRIDLGEWKSTLATLEKLAGTAHELARTSGCLVVGLGGDHSVSWPLVRACAREHGRTGIIQFDVHHDVRDLDDGPSNGTPIRGLVEDGIVDPIDIVQVGIHPFGNRRALTRYCDQQGIARFSLEQVREVGMRTVVESALGMLEDCNALYLTVDIDVLDRAFAPGTVAALPGGLTTAELMAGIDVACSHPQLRAMDIVEFDPTRDIASTTAYNAALALLTALSAAARRSKD